MFRISSDGKEGKLKKAVCAPLLRNVPGAAEFLCPDVMIYTKFTKAQKLSVNCGDIAACSKGQAVAWSANHLEVGMNLADEEERSCIRVTVAFPHMPVTKSEWPPCRRQHPCLLSLQFSLTRCPTYRDVFRRPLTQQDGLVILLYSGSSSTWSALQLFVFPVFLLCSLPWLLHNRSDTASCSQSFKCRSMPFDSSSLNKSK